MKFHFSLFRRLLLIFLVVTSAAATAQEAYPSKPIRLIVPFAAGGITDVMGRLVARGLSEELKQPVVVENKAGASGAIGAQLVARGPKDGYSLLLGTVSTQVVNPLLYKKLPYDVSELEPVSLIVNSPYILAITKVPGVTDFSSLVKYAADNPNALFFGSAGNGTAPHLGLESFKLATGTKIVHVPYKSGAEAIAAAIEGSVQLVMDAFPVINAQVAAGRLTPIVIADGSRNSAMPDVKTSAELGYPDFIIGSWNALLVPAGTPPARIAILNQALKRVMERQDTKDQLQRYGISPLPLGPQAYAERVTKETRRWTQIVREVDIKLD
jgi:tripartite-type tricarboxylate transporter receptor subunit TctC